jgi:uncharacterized protein YgiM (DUF1202 family)
MKNSASSNTFLPRFSVALAGLILALATVARAEQGVVQGNRCNVRVLPDPISEVVIQLNKGERVEILERKTVTDAGKARDWLRITLPPGAKCYVNARFVKDGVMTGEGVYVRSGPGTNFRTVGQLAKGDRVEVVSQAGEWVRIQPTPKCSGWIAAELVSVEAAAAVPPLPPAPPPQVTEVLPPEPVMVPLTPPASPAPSPAPTIRAVETDPEEYIYYTVKVGVLQAVRDPATAPGSYQLMTPEVERRQHRIAYLETTELNLDRYDGKNVRVFGNLRWRKGERWPLIVVERVDRVW